MTLYDLVKKMIETKPNDEALVFEHKHYKFAQVGEGILNAARKLNALGVKKRDVVTVLLPNCPESVFIFYAVNAIGAISYLVHPLTPAATVKKLVERVNSKFVICLADHAFSNKEVLPGDVKVVAINPYADINIFKSLAFSRNSKKSKDVIDYSKIKGEPFEPYIQEQEREDAVYMNTGGTTGEMKIVRLSNEAINHIGYNSVDLVRDKVPESKLLAALPFFHVFGLGMGLHVPMSMGGVACLMIKFSTKEAIKQIRKGNATIILGVPGLFNALLSKEKFYGPHLKKQVCGYLGGDVAPDGLVERWDEAMEKYGSSSRLYVGYGLTETSTACNVNTMYGRNKKGSVGRPIGGVKNKIVDLETGKECPPNVLGEILIGGPSLMNGYFDDEKLTLDTMFLDENGEKWLHTKDYGYIDEDGYLFYKQRTRRIVKINGETLCPTDVEKVVGGLPFVFECFCHGVEHEKKGQSFRLIVVLKRSKNKIPQDDAKAKIEEAIRSSLLPAYFPKEILFVDKLPHTPLAKIDPVKAEQL